MLVGAIYADQVKTFLRRKQCIVSPNVNVLSLSLQFAFTTSEAQQTWNKDDFRVESYNFKQSSFMNKESINGYTQSDSQLCFLFWGVVC